MFLRHLTNLTELVFRFVQARLGEVLVIEEKELIVYWVD